MPAATVMKTIYAVPMSWILLLALIAASGCQGSPVRVLTSFQPLYSLAKEVAGPDGGLVVQNLASRTVGPHEYDAGRPPWQASFRAMVRDADAIVTLGEYSLSPLFDDLFAHARAANVRIVEVDPGRPWLDEPPLLLLPNPDGSINPHVWLSLTHAAQMAERLADDFALLDPAHGGTYRRRAAAYGQRLRELRAGYASRVAELERAEVVVVTEGFPYLMHDLGIWVVDTILEPLDPEALEARLTAAGAPVVVAESMVSGASQAAIERAGARLLVLSTLEHGYGSSTQLDPAGYWKGMVANLEALVGALEESLAGD